jgi:iron complex outermembrane receptor protein
MSRRSLSPNMRRLLMCTSLLSGAVFALGAHADPASDPTAALDEVVVTGTHVRSEFNSTLPVQVITAEAAELRGVADTTAMLQTSSLATGSYQTNNMLTGYVVDGGSGVNTISLRGLGANRTLVLLNGRRMGPAGVGGTVGPIDLNTIPQSTIERVDILKDGASSIYGSDAVAGVVNIITKTKMDGGQLTAYASDPVAGAGQSYRLNGSWGKTFDRGYLLLGGEYFEQKALRRRNRDDTACSADMVDAYSGGPRVDYTASDGSYKCYNQLSNVIYGRYNGSSAGYMQYRQDGVAYPTVAATQYASLARQTVNGVADTFSYANYDSESWNNSTVISPVKRYSVTASGAYDVSAHVQAYGEFLFNRRQSEQDGSRQLFPTVSTSNPNAYVDGVSVNGYPVISLASDYSQTVDYFRGVGGLRGDIAAGPLNGWTWDIYAEGSHSHGKYQKDVIYNDAIAATTGASACNQSLVTISGGDCSTLSGGIPWYSQRVLAGNFTDAERAFLFGVDYGETTYDQTLLEGSLSGDLFRLPAGMVSGAFGLSIRHERINDNPGYETVASNLWGQTTAGITKGDDTVKEAFAEITAPLAKDLPLIHSLELNVSGRWTDYDSYGSQGTYKVGLAWKPVDQILVRGTYGTSFRAPTLYELYLADQTSFLGQTSVDPCINYGTNASSVVAGNCAAAGIPSDYAGAGSSAEVSTGGGRNLKAETSKAWTLGVTWTPHFADLSIAVDYFDIRVANEIRQFGAANILAQCYQGDAAYCTLFTRDPTTFQVLTVDNGYVNVASQVNRGIDLTIRYARPLGSWGDLRLDGQFTWQLEDRTQLLGGADAEDYNGSTYGYDGPDFTGQVQARIDHGPWTYAWSIDVYGKGSDTEIYGDDTYTWARYGTSVYYKQYTEFTAYHTATVRRRFDDMTAEVGIQNIFDEPAPSASYGQFRTGTAALNGYDYLGRRVFVSVTKTW